MAKVSRVLFVGCGGSGGVTLRFTMDSLRSQIRQWNDARIVADGPDAAIDFGPSGLPACWQFVHIDVPSAPDGISEDRPPSVPDMGGTYVPLARAGISYQAVCNELWNLTEGKASGAQLHGWIKKPGPDDPNLSQGAGQMRSVGRAVSLYSAGSIYAALDRAATALVSADSEVALGKLKTLMGGHSVGENTEPLVVFVSSMSGGAGASMVLDVARLMVRVRPGWQQNTCMFLYTSEVFSSLDEGSRLGVEGNGLAAMGELLATSLGANSAEHVLLGDMGLTGPIEPPIQTFMRVIPIGNRQGAQAALFGDGSMDTIYRSFGRGLAALVASPEALGEFIDFDLTNTGSTLPVDKTWLGHGLETSQPVLWGNFGFGRLSLGREKYAEYFSQRIARAAIDRLCGDDTARGQDQQSLAAQSDNAFAQFLAMLGLPQSGQRCGVIEMLGRELRDPRKVVANIGAPATQILRERIYQKPMVSQVAAGRPYIEAVRQIGAGESAIIMRDVYDKAYPMAYAWMEGFVNDLLKAVEDIASLQGLPVARQVVLRLKTESAMWASALAEEASKQAPHGGGSLPPLPSDLAEAISTQAAFGLDHPLRRQLESKHAMAVTKVAGGVIAKLLSEAMSELGERFANPLAQDIAATLAKLEAERDRVVRRVGSADPKTSNYSEWPVAGGKVPERFKGAHNEVMLSGPEEFPLQFDAHISQISRSRGLISEGQVQETVVREVLTDRWMGRNEELITAGVLSYSTPWVPKSFTIDPERTAMLRPASRAEFSMSLNPSDILSRARTWTNRPDGELSDYLRQGIRGYVQDGGPSAVDILASKFQTLLHNATPLVQVDQNAFAVLHRGAKLQLAYKYSAVPLLDIPNGADQRLRDVLTDMQGLSDKEIDRFNSALNQSAATDHIDVFGSYKPQSPLVVTSLLEPIATALARANASGGVADIWRNRRARPLTGAIALTKVDRKAMAAGYLVGKITGRIRGSYQDVSENHNGRIEVFSAKDEWLAFPRPLLSPHIGRYGDDEFAAILEAHLVAIVQCSSDPTLGPLRAYLSLRELYGMPIEDDFDHPFDPDKGARLYLEMYVNGTDAIPGQGARSIDKLASEFNLSEPEGRRDAARKYLTDLARNISEAHATPTALANRYDVRPLLRPLYPDIVWATEQLVALLDSDGPAKNEGLGF